MSRLFAAIAVPPSSCPRHSPRRTDTSVGSGNTAQQPLDDSALSASTYRELQFRNDLQGRTVLPTHSRSTARSSAPRETSGNHLASSGHRQPASR
jgi:hypothetical protein